MTTIEKPFKQAPVFIIGLQKSGTSLLNRLLIQHSDFFFSPFKLEGRAFWGDDPPFSPEQPPCGRIYQQKQGLMGHHADGGDYHPDDLALLLSQVNDLTFEAPVWINKNPYNTVRVAWLRSMFPDSFIIAVIRKPEANVFSLKKKFIPHENRGLGPENGWWGVKPKGWHKMVSNNTLTQLSHQWRAVNQELLKHLDAVNMLVDYQEVCQCPAAVVNAILGFYGIDSCVEMAAIPDMNHEYKQGSRLLSMNREYQLSSSDLDLSNSQTTQKEIGRLSFFDRMNIRRICQSTWNQCQKSRTRLNYTL